MVYGPEQKDTKILKRANKVLLENHKNTIKRRLEPLIMSMLAEMGIKSKVFLPNDH
jgi:hypothetical protein